MSKPDQPNSPRHAHLMAQWREGQIFETRIDDCAHDEDAWVPVANGGRAQPTWDHHQEYRRREDLERLAAAAADPATIGREGLLRAQALIDGGAALQQQPEPANVTEAWNRVRAEARALDGACGIASLLMAVEDYADARAALQQQPEPVAQDRDLHSHMMVVAMRAARGIEKDRPAEKEVLRAVCRAIAADKNLRAKLYAAPPAIQQVRRIEHTPGGMPITVVDAPPALQQQDEPSEPLPLPEFQEATWGVDSTMRPCKSMAISEYAFRQWAQANGITLADGGAHGG